jgi:3-dehydroquinate dehydratase / shikimate dehydrogenase
LLCAVIALAPARWSRRQDLIVSQALICETATGRTLEELRARRDAATRADLVELRLDWLERPDVAGALEGRPKPVVVTCRPKWEGGRFDGAEQERLNLLSQALELGAEFVDLEWRASASARWLTPTNNARVVVSFHAFDRMPAELEDLVREMRRVGAGIVKLAVPITTQSEVARLLRLGRSQRDASTRFVLVGMGDAGLPTRVLPAHFGSAWTYAGDAVAPGQITTTRLLDEFGIDRACDSTPVYGVVGRPISHSVSPAMHNAGFRSTGRPGIYVPFEATDFADFLALAEELPLAGVSVTAPFKREAWQLVQNPAAPDVMDETAGLAVVNTLRRRDGRWEGTNTDIEGFLTPLSRQLPLAGLRAAVLGAGGAARAAAFALARAGARVSVHARRPDAAAAAVAGLDQPEGVARAAGFPPRPGSWDVLVNATPVGTWPNIGESPMAGQPLDGRLVYDLVYNPRTTRLLADAASAGCAMISGLEMLVEQGVRQFEWWTGVAPSRDVFRAAAEQRLRDMAGEGGAP